ncbi:hypothetical protein B0A49_13878, partial [Cryomyces minteri]
QNEGVAKGTAHEAAQIADWLQEEGEAMVERREKDEKKMEKLDDGPSDAVEERDS